MVSKNQIKLISSLQQKKQRQVHKLFFAEGIKVVQELLFSNFELEHLFTTEAIFTEIPTSKQTLITDIELKKLVL